MTIGIDASRYQINQPTGTEIYSRQIVDELLKQKNSKDEIRLYVPRELEEIKKQIKRGKLKGVKQIVIKQKKLWTQEGLSLHFLTHRRPEVFFVPAHTLPLIHPARSVVVIHDLAFKYYPKAYSDFALWYLDWSTRFAVKHAKKIITISKATRRDLVKFYNCPPEKIAVVYLGTNFLPETKLNAEIVLPKYKLSKRERYFLYVGRIEEKKNLVNLVKAYEIAQREFHELKLVLAGKLGFKGELVLKTIENLGLKAQVIVTGYVPDEHLAILYQNAYGFVLPSLYEGFGMPILEAFSKGIPVLTSKTSSLPEMGGKACLYVDPQNVEDISRGLRELYLNKILRLALIKQGAKRLKNFSWEKCGQETMRVLKEAGRE